MINQNAYSISFQHVSQLKLATARLRRRRIPVQSPSETVQEVALQPPDSRTPTEDQAYSRMHRMNMS